MSTSSTTVPAPLDPLPGSEVGEARVEALTLPQLRELRRRLRDESERAAYWHRLARARLDLVVARALEGDPGVRSGGTASAADEPPLAGSAPCFDALRELLLDDGDRDVVDRLHRINGAERELRGYCSAVRAAADEATGELVRRYHEQPATCLSAVPPLA